AGIVQWAGALTNLGTIHVVAGPAQRYLQGALVNEKMFVVDPGANFITLLGSFTNAPTGVLRTTIASLSSFTHLHPGAPVNLGGTLTIVSPYTPAVGDTFPIIACSACETGAFAKVNGAALPGGLAYQVTSTASGTTLVAKKAADLTLAGSAPASIASGAT